MEGKNINIPDGWKKKRTFTLAMFIMSYFVQGVEFTTIFATLWSYVNGGLSNSNPDLWYGLIAGGRFLVPVLFSTLVAKWFDATRAMRQLMVSVTLLMNIGYVLYLVNLSPYIPMIGMILQGSSFLLELGVNSEAIRVYSGDEVQRNMLFFLLAYGVGETVGPLIIKSLDSVHFNIGTLQITYGNIAGLILLTLNTIRLGLVPFCTYNLSKEFDLKAHEAELITTAAKNSKSSLQKLKETFIFDAGFLLVHTLYSGFLTSFIARSFPLITTNTLRYSNLVLDVCFIGASILMTVISAIINATKPSSKAVYACGIASVVSLLISQIVLFLIPKGLSEPVNIVLLSTLVLAYALCWVTTMTYLVVTLGKLFPSSVQSSIEGIRIMIHIVGSFTASLASAYLYINFQYVFIVSLPITLILLGVMLARRHVLSNPQVRASDNDCSFRFNGLREVTEDYGSVD